MFQLSGGEKQKIACASVSVTDNPIIVLDKPSANLDLKENDPILEAEGENNCHCRTQIAVSSGDCHTFSLYEAWKNHPRIWIWGNPKTHSKGNHGYGTSLSFL